MSLEADIEDIQSGLKAPKKVIVFVDELNKYAPEGAKGSPILDQVLEVSERGRSLGIVLYGAQQFLSAVHDRVTGNCSTTLLGRTNASEMAERSYRFLNRDIKAAATRLEKGQLILNLTSQSFSIARLIQPRSKRILGAASSAVISVQRAEGQRPVLFVWRLNMSCASAALATSILLPLAIGVPFASASTQ